MNSGCWVLTQFEESYDIVSRELLAIFQNKPNVEELQKFFTRHSAASMFHIRNQFEEFAKSLLEEGVWESDSGLHGYNLYIKKFERC